MSILCAIFRVLPFAVFVDLSSKLIHGIIMMLVCWGLHALPAMAGVAASWSDLPMEKRCEGFLEFMMASSKKELAEWKITKATCIAEGSVLGELNWNFEASWQKGSKALPLRYQVTEVQKLKGQVQWCVTKGKNTGCASPWEHSFSKGNMFHSSKDAAAAYEGVRKISIGFSNLALRLDEWVSKKGPEVKIYGLTFEEWVKAWVTSPRSLPVQKEIVTAEFTLDKAIPTSGYVKFMTEIPQSLRQCFGCPKSACDRSPIVFHFSGLGLTLSRDLTVEEQQVDKRKTASASWIIMEATPFINKEAKWPMMCGDHRINIQKL